ncbi:MAG: type II secretion system protein [Planococcus donghaensis]
MRDENGITLVELLAFLAISSIIMVVIMSVFSTGVNSSERTASRQQLQQEANVIVEQIRATYLENEKNASIDKNFKVRVDTDKLMITKIDGTSEKIISSGYQYSLGTGTGPAVVVMERTKVSPFYIKICSGNQCFEVQTSFSKVN